MPGHKIGGTADIHEVLLLIQAVSGPIYETRPTQTHLAASACQMATYVGRGGTRLWQ